VIRTRINNLQAEIVGIGNMEVEDLEL